MCPAALRPCTMATPSTRPPLRAASTTSVTALASRPLQPWPLYSWPPSGVCSKAPFRPPQTQSRAKCSAARPHPLPLHRPPQTHPAASRSVCRRTLDLPQPPWGLLPGHDLLFSEGQCGTTPPKASGFDGAAQPPPLSKDGGVGTVCCLWGIFSWPVNTDVKVCKCAGGGGEIRDPGVGEQS